MEGIPDVEPYYFAPTRLGKYGALYSDNIKVVGSSFGNHQATIAGLVQNEPLLASPHVFERFLTDENCTSIQTLGGVKFAHVPQMWNSDKAFRVPILMQVNSVGQAGNGQHGAHVRIPCNKYNQPFVMPLPFPNTQQGKEIMEDLRGQCSHVYLRERIRSHMQGPPFSLTLNQLESFAILPIWQYDEHNRVARVRKYLVTTQVRVAKAFKVFFPENWLGATREAVDRAFRSCVRHIAGTNDTNPYVEQYLTMGRQFDFTDWTIEAPVAPSMTEQGIHNMVFFFTTQRPPSLHTPENMYHLGDNLPRSAKWFYEGWYNKVIKRLLTNNRNDPEVATIWSHHYPAGPAPPPPPPPMAPPPGAGDDSDDSDDDDGNDGGGGAHAVDPGRGGGGGRRGRGGRGGGRGGHVNDVGGLVDAVAGLQLGNIPGVNPGPSNTQNPGSPCANPADDGKTK